MPAWWWAYSCSTSTAGDGRGVWLSSVSFARSRRIGVGFRAGLEDVKDRDAQLMAFESDLREGMPPSQLVARHQRTLFPFPEDGGAFFHDGLTANFSDLNKQGVGAFISLGTEVRFREVALSEIARSIGSTRTSEGLTQTWTLTLDSFVYGMRMTIPATLDSSSRSSRRHLVR